MKKRWIGVMMAAVLGLSLAGCGTKDTGAGAGSDAGSTAAKSQAETSAAETKDGSTEAVKAANEEQSEAETGEAAVPGEGGTLIVGFDQDFPPMGFLGDDGEYTGFDLELAQEAAKRPGEAAVPGEGGTLIVGFDQDFPPMGFLGDDGEYTGFDLELAQEAAKRLGLTYQPQPGGTLIVGFDQDFPPMGFLGDDGEYTGFDLELAQEAAKRLGLTYQPQPIAWDAKDMELDTGNIDCIWNGFTMNGREDNYTWSDPYMDNSQIFVVDPESGIKTLADLAGKVVEVQVDSSAQAALEEMPDLAGTFAELVVTPDYNTAFMDLEQGAVDAIAMDVTVAGYMIQERQSDFVILDESISSEVYAIGFKKGNTQLRDQVQGALEEMAADGTLTAISEKWFGKDVTIISK